MRRQNEAFLSYLFITLFWYSSLKTLKQSNGYIEPKAPIHSNKEQHY